MHLRLGFLFLFVYAQYVCIRGGSSGRVLGVHNFPPPPPSPEMTFSFLIQLVFTSGHQSVTPFLNGVSTTIITEVTRQ